MKTTVNSIRQQPYSNGKLRSPENLCNLSVLIKKAIHRLKKYIKIRNYGRGDYRSSNTCCEKHLNAAQRHMLITLHPIISVNFYKYIKLEKP